MHDECFEVETEFSFVRRLAQGRIDIMTAELERRASGGSITDLVAALPEILSDSHPRSDPASSRLPRHLAPAPAIEWKRGLEHLITDATLLNLPTLPDDEVRERMVQLRELEQETSERRRSLNAVIDLLDAEIVSRHALGRS
jgi:hypothetical protein